MNAEATATSGQSNGVQAEVAPADPSRAKQSGDASADPAQTAEGGPAKAEGKRSAPSPKKPLASIEDVVSAAYTTRARLLEASGDTLRKLSLEESTPEQQSVVIREAAQADRTLAGAFRLLQLSASKGVDLRRAESGVAGVLKRLTDLAEMAMTDHPVFRPWATQLADPKAEPELTPRLVRQLAKETPPSKFGVKEDAFTKADNLRLQSNAVACLGLLRILRGHWSLDEFVDALHDHDWAHEVPLESNPLKAAAAIASDRQKDVLAIVSARYLRTVASLKKQVRNLSSEVEATGNREAKLKADLRDAAAREKVQTDRLQASNDQVERLQEELAHEREVRAVDRSHMSDDYEVLRTRIIRLVGGEVDLLTDGLHALRNGAPEVADEFLDRSLAALNRELQALRAAGGTR